MIFEHHHHPFGFFVPQQPVIDEAAMQSIANRSVHQRRRDARVHPTTQRANHVISLANFFFHDLNLLFQNVRHGPTSFALCNVKQEMFQRSHPFLGVRHLWVILQTEQILRLVFNCNHASLLALTDAFKSVRQHRRLVPVRHPDVLRLDIFAEQFRVRRNIHHRHPPKLTFP